MSWLRWWDGTCADPKWRVVAARSKQPVGMVVSIWAWLLEQARPNNGDLGVVDAEAIAITYGYDIESVSSILSAMKAKGVITDAKLAAWDKRQPKRDDDSRDRVASWRAKKNDEKKQADTKGVTRCNAGVTRCSAPDTEAEADTEDLSLRSRSERAPLPDIELSNEATAEPETGSPSRQELDHREDAMRRAAGTMPVAIAFDLSSMHQLIRNGYSLEQDILPAIRNASLQGARLKRWSQLVGWVETTNRQRIKAEGSKPVARQQISDPNSPFAGMFDHLPVNPAMEVFARNFRTEEVH